MNAGLSPYERLFLALAQTTEIDSARNAIRSDREVGDAYDLDEFFATTKRLETGGVHEFVRVLRELTPKSPAEILALYVFRYLMRSGDSLTQQELSLISSSSVTSAHPLIAIYEARAMVYSGDANKAKKLLEQSLKAISREDATPYGRYVYAAMSSVLGLSYQKLGNFQRAHRCLKDALEICRTDKFAGEWSHGQRLATLLWSTGQYREALLIHKNDKIRDEARRKHKFDYLLSSYLSASKCAIDLKQTDLAEQELAAAQEILDSDHTVRKELSGYYLLFSGEVQVQKGDVQKAVTLLQMAQKYFEKMSPPHHPGALEAKIALAHFALYEKNYALALQILQKLLAEAEKKQCLEARSRLLLLETFLFVTEEPPVRRAYDDLITRLHLINNPAFLLRALGNLYTYALEFLDEEQQAFLLMRIKNLKPVLDASCYDDLYRSYVSERYEYAIENRLARFVGKDWDGWQALIEDADDEPPGAAN